MISIKPPNNTLETNTYKAFLAKLGSIYVVHGEHSMFVSDSPRYLPDYNPLFAEVDNQLALLPSFCQQKKGTTFNSLVFMGAAFGSQKKSQFRFGAVVSVSHFHTIPQNTKA